jgi:hypothetical protein
LELVWDGDVEPPRFDRDVDVDPRLGEWLLLVEL